MIIPKFNNKLGQQLAFSCLQQDLAMFSLNFLPKEQAIF